LALARRNRTLRRRVEEGLASATAGFALARASMGPQAVDASLLAPAQTLSVEVGQRNLMSVVAPTFAGQFRSHSGGAAYPYGLAFTSADLDGAVGALSGVLPDLLALAEVEKSCQMLAAEIERTRRRVNALEYVVIPRTSAAIRAIAMKLDENERGTQVRLMKVKDMILEQAHRYGAR
ncbi:MAG: V-type ATP synthase subunit D, partial [Clostridiales bacterium]|nr:V-type ATP synthase subunit D [Clostridiales bacterium]